MPAVVHRLGEERDQLIVRAVVSLKGGGGVKEAHQSRPDRIR